MIKRCKLCGVEFEANSPRQLYCKRVVQKKCAVCGNLFDTLCSPGAPITCNNLECRRSASTSGKKLQPRICRVCNESFIPSSARQLDCGKQITKKCVICGASFTDKCGLNFTRATCSNLTCKSKYAHQKSVESYQDTVKRCILCNKDFTPVNNTQVVCSRRHFKRCAVCGKHFEVVMPKSANVKDIALTCSKECATQLKFKDGNPLQDPKLRDKAKNTMLEKYGVEHPMQSPEIRAKVDATMIAKYGVTRYAQTSEYLEHVISTNQEKYGVNWPMQLPEIRQKAADTLMSHYGVTNPGSSAELHEKAVQSYKSRTGYEYPLQNPQVVEQLQATNIERYGTPYAINSSEIKSKIQSTIVSRYGVDNAMQNSEVKAKMKATTLARYGNECYLASPEGQSKSAEALERMYGKRKYSQTAAWKQLKLRKCDNLEEWMKFAENTEEYLNQYQTPPTYKELAEKFGVYIDSVYEVVSRKHLTHLISRVISYMEAEVCELLDSLNINYTLHDRSQISPYELDIYMPDRNFAIECNPTVTHNSSKPDPWGRMLKSNYHYMKTNMCLDKNIFLYHIFGYEWTHNKDIVKSMIVNILGVVPRKIYARKCDIRLVSGIDCAQFLTQNHRQGAANSKIRLGLYYNDELVSLMTFGKLRATMGTGTENLNDCWELVRFCNVLNTTVVGGASKLFKHFVATYSPERIRSFSDRAHTKGSLYNILGFKQVNCSDANYVWVNEDTDKAYHRVNAQKRNLKKFLHDDTIDLTQTETQIMKAHGFVQVFDSGTITWEWMP